ncbi:MAG: fibronectin type III domain-containing protein [Elusimicrobia bacterium]|nr:fibronectin type III domain-containing protein [Elusimicrobiota bacterium]
MRRLLWAAALLCGLAGSAAAQFGPMPILPGDTSYVGGERPVLSFAPASGSTELQLALDSGFTQVIQDTVTSNTSVQSTNTLTAGQTYWWRVADATAFPITFGTPVSFTVDLAPPSLTGAQAAALPAGPYQALGGYVSSPSVSLRVSAQDAAAGLLISPPPPTGIVGQWHLDEGSGSVALDASGSSSTGTLVNSPAWAAGRRGGALTFDGTSQYVGLGAPSVLSNLTFFTVEAWVKTSGAVTAQSAVVGQNYGRFQLVIVNHKAQIQFQATDLSFPAATSLTSVDDGSWHMLAGSWDGTTLTVYVDGVPEASTTPGLTQNLSGTDCAWDIGGFVTAACGGGAFTAFSGQFLAGTVDEVRVFSQPPSSPDLSGDYQSDFLGAHAEGSAYGVLFSTTAGASWDLVSTQSVTLAGGDRTTAAQTFEADNIPLVTSAGPGAPTDQVAFVVSDFAGNTSTSVYTVLVDTTTPPVPVGPANGVAVGTTAPVLAFTVVSPGMVRVQVASDSGFTSVVADSTTANAFFQPSGLTSGQTYFWRLHAAGSPNPATVWSAAQSFTVDAAPPVFSAPQVSTSPVGAWASLPSAAVLSTTSVSLRATVQDALSGLLVTSGLPPGLAGQWHFDESSGTVALDASTNGVVGSVSGASWTAGHSGSALSFSGPATVLLGNPPALTGLTAFTAEAWVKTSAPVTAEAGIVQQAYGRFALVIGADHKAQVKYYGTNLTYPMVESLTSVDDGAWHHVAGTFDGFFLSIYVDGRLEAHALTSDIPPFTTATDCPVSIGGLVNAGCSAGGAMSTDYFPGAIDEVRLFSGARTADQILADVQSDSAAAQQNGAAYSVLYSTTAGASWAFVSSQSVTLGGGNGTTAAQTLEAANIPLVSSAGPGAPTDQVAFVVSDFAGNVSTAVFTVLVDTGPPEAPAAASPAFLAVTTTTVQAQWGAVPVATSYTLVASTDGVNPLTAVAASSTTAASTATLAGLAQDTTYYLFVSASGPGGQSAYAALGSTITGVGAPGLASPTFLAVTTTTVQAQWGGVPSATGYTLFASTDGINPLTAVAASSTTAASTATLTGLAQDTTYYLFVAAAGPGGESAYSTLGSTITGVGAPGVVSPTVLAVTPTSVQAQWGAVPRATGYTLLVSTDSANPLTAVAASSTTAASTATVTGLSQGTTYFLFVAAAGPGGRSAYAALGSTITGVGAPGLASPVVLAVTTTTLQAQWGLVPAATGYTLVASTDSANPPTAVAASSTTAASTATVAGLAQDTLYYLFVSAAGPGGQSGYTALGSTITGVGAPALAAPPVLAVTATSIQAQWAAVARATGYTLIASTDSVNPLTAVAASSTTAASTATVTGLVPGTVYYLFVSAAGAGGASPYSALGPAATASGNPAPTGLSVLWTSSSTASLAWRTGGNAAGTVYDLQRSPDGFSWTPVLTTTALSARAAGLASSTAYQFRVGASGQYSAAVAAVTTDFDETFASGENASHVLGQAFFTGSAAAATRTGMSAPAAVVLDPAGKRAFVADAGNSRVLVFDLSSGASDGMAASHVLGQATFTGSAAGTSASAMNKPQALAYDAAGRRLFVADTYNNRVLEFDLAAGVTDGMSAAHVLGQTGFTANGTATTQSGMSYPYALAFDPALGRLFVADWANNRVLGFDASTTVVDGMPASFVLGQSTWSTNAAATTASGMSAPTALAYSAADQDLYVGDGFNNRVLAFDLSGAVTSGMSASAVLGQPGFVTKSPAATATGMEAPIGIAVDESSKRVFVSNAGGVVRNRVLVYDVSAGITNGMAAQAAVGQPDLTSIAAAASRSGLSGPLGVSFDAGGRRLAVADADNNRVTFYEQTLVPTVVNPPVVSDASNAMTLRWGLAAGATSYTLAASTSSANPPVALTAVAAAAASPATLSGLAQRTSYYIFVSATGDGGPSPYAALGLAVTAADVASSVQQVTSDTLKAAWATSAFPAGSSFAVRIATASDFSVFTASAAATTGQQLFAGLAPNTSYYLRVGAPDGGIGPTLSTATLPAPAASPTALSLPGSGVRLGWSAAGNPSDTSFDADLSTAADMATLTASSVTLSTSADFTSLSPHTTYYLRVRALGRDGTPTAFTAIVDTTTTIAQPASLSASTTTSSLLLLWASGGNPAGTQYVAQLSTASDFTGSLSSTTTPATQAAFVSLAPNTTYFLRVKASGGSSADSPYVPLTAVTLAAAPSATTLVAVSTDQLSLSWSAGVDPAGTIFAAQVSTDAAFTAVAGSSATLAVSATVQALSPNTTYYARVQAVDFAGAGSAFDASVSTVTPAAAPTGPSFDSVRATTATAVWSAAGNPADTRYVAQVSTASDFTGALTASDGTGAQASFYDLTPFTTYYLRVKAVDRAGRETAFTVSAGSGVTPGAPPPTPDLTAVSLTTDTIAWKWAVGAGSVDDFILWASTGGAVARLSGSATYYAQSGLSASSRYAAYLEADNGAGQVFSSTVTAATPAAIVSVSAGSGGHISDPTTGRVAVLVPIGASTMTLGVLITTDPLHMPLTDATVSLIDAANRSLPKGLQGAGSSLREFLLTDAGTRYTGSLDQDMTVTVPYPDSNNDGFVDGTSPPVAAAGLSLYTLDEKRGVWVQITPTTVDTVNHTVSGPIPHLSIFMAFGAGPAQDLSNVRAYPDPYEPNAGNPDHGRPYSASDPQSGIIFDNLPDSVEIKIFDLAGRLVVDLEPQSTGGQIQWDARNGRGRDVATGAYIAVITSPGSNPVIKKLLISR